MGNSNCQLISIITPVYNHSSFIAECIQSVLAQSYPKWEMIIIDDGSTDNSSEIIESYILKDSRIQLIKQSNIGILRLAETYNKAFSFSKGDFIAILEGDDYWEKDKLEKQINAFNQNKDSVLCWGQAYSVSHDKKTNYGLNPPLNKFDLSILRNKPAGNILNHLMFSNCIPALTIMIRRDALDEIGGFKQCCGLPLIDLPTLFELALCGSFTFVPSPLGTWRNYSTQITKTLTSQLMEGYKTLAVEFYHKIKDKRFLNSDINLSNLLKHYNKQLIVSYSRSGRYKLIRKEFKSARKDYLKSIFSFGCHNLIWKLRSVIGYVFSLFQLNVEGLSKILGKKSYID